MANANADIALTAGYDGCGGFNSLFGYERGIQSSGKYLGYTYNIPSTNYYAINLKIKLVFID